MTLSGLALAVGILVDEATVAIENIHTHLGMGKRSGRAVVDAMREVMQPRLLAMLAILAVFLPTFFLVGISRSLFPPLARAVGFSMIASFLLSTTLVPVLATRLFLQRASRWPRFSGRPVRPRDPRLRALHRAGGRRSLGRRPLVSPRVRLVAPPGPRRRHRALSAGGHGAVPAAHPRAGGHAPRAHGGHRARRRRRDPRRGWRRPRPHDARQHRQPGVDVPRQRDLRLQLGARRTPCCSPSCRGRTGSGCRTSRSASGAASRATIPACTSRSRPATSCRRC